MKGIGIYGEDFIQLKENEELIKENIRRVLTTVPGEQVGNLKFGSRIREYLFNFSSVLIEDLEQVIISSISVWEPRVNVLNIDILIDDKVQEKINVDLILQLKDSLDTFNLNLPIKF